MNHVSINTFPLPHNAQVTGFRAKLKDSEIEGEFREKNEAYKEYDNALRRGDAAFLLESHRPDIFQMSLGNISAGEATISKNKLFENNNIVDTVQDQFYLSIGI